MRSRAILKRVKIDIRHVAILKQRDAEQTPPVEETSFITRSGYFLLFLNYFTLLGNVWLNQFEMNV